MNAEECFDACKAGGYSCGGGTELREKDVGCCNRLSCFQACIMRVRGLSLSECSQQVYDAAQGSACSLSISGFMYDICNGFGESTCEVSPTIESGLYGCHLGDTPNASAVDPYCWVYREDLQSFEPFGQGSQVGLTWDI